MSTLESIGSRKYWEFDKTVTNHSRGYPWTSFFLVMGGVVSLRDYRNVDDMKLSKASLLKRKKGGATPRKKTKLCWFHMHHPQGCVLQTDHCAYAHGETDIRIHTDHSPWQIFYSEHTILQMFEFCISRFHKVLIEMCANGLLFSNTYFLWYGSEFTVDTR